MSSEEENALKQSVEEETFRKLSSTSHSLIKCSVSSFFLALLKEDIL